MKHLKLGSGRLYQFTAIDDRQRLPMAIERIKTDHGSEVGTDFAGHLHDLGITHRPIPRRSPESSAKVERSHRTDEEEFYRRVTFWRPQELRRLLQEWEHEHNHRRPHPALGGKAPAEHLCELRITIPQSVRESA